MTTRVVHMFRDPGFDVYIGRPGRGKSGYFGNPFKMVGHSEAERTRVIEEFKAYFLERVESDPVYRKKVLALKDKRLGCFCAPLACHGDVIAEWLDENA